MLKATHVSQLFAMSQQMYRQASANGNRLSAITAMHIEQRRGSVESYLSGPVGEFIGVFILFVIVFALFPTITSGINELTSGTAAPLVGTAATLLNLIPTFLVIGLLLLTVGLGVRAFRK